MGTCTQTASVILRSAVSSAARLRLFVCLRSSALLDHQILVGVFGHLKADTQPTKGRVAEISFLLFDKTTATLDIKGRDICLDRLDGY